MKALLSTETDGDRSGNERQMQLDEQDLAPRRDILIQVQAKKAGALLLDKTAGAANTLPRGPSRLLQQLRAE